MQGQVLSSIRNIRTDRILQHPAVKDYQLHRYIRMIMCGAAPLSFELNQKLFELLPNAHIGQAYGKLSYLRDSIIYVCGYSMTYKRHDRDVYSYDYVANNA
jgi:acyl-CoA synthetase (AMP-forming)/AMP-acid ligase II